MLLRGWRRAVEEAFRATGVPEGRDQVLAATHFFSGEAQKWWATTVGQPQDELLTTFEELCKALEENFVPQDAERKAMAAWNSLRQRGTTSEYMKKVDELATAHPMGEVGEFWHAWNGLRPELQAEVKYALDERGKDTCSRQELRQMLRRMEIRYPAVNVRPFFPRPQPKHVETRTVTASPSVTCWICDRTGHRATECTRRKTSGCPRCGSKAHNLLVCPQRGNRRSEGSAKVPGVPPKPKPKPPPK